jgi:hypothetical protein
MQVVLAFTHAPTLQADNSPGPYSNAELAVLWLDWCAELGDLSEHKLLLIGPYGFELPQSVRSWGSFEYVVDRRNVVGWPAGPNSMFEQAGWHLALRKNDQPFFWCEPDCVPVRSGWLAEIEHEYRNVALPARKPFMGVLVKGTGSYPEHMNGNGVYPANFYALAPRLMERKLPQIAFDIRGAAQVVPRCHHTTLISHQYRRGAIQSLEDYRATVPEGAALYHSDKYARVIAIMRAKRDGKLADPLEPVQVAADGKVSTLVTLDSICGLIRDHVKTDSQRQRLMRFLRENNYHIVNFGSHAFQKKKEPLAASSIS